MPKNEKETFISYIAQEDLVSENLRHSLLAAQAPPKPPRGIIDPNFVKDQLNAGDFPLRTLVSNEHNQVSQPLDAIDERKKELSRSQAFSKADEHVKKVGQKFSKENNHGHAEPIYAEFDLVAKDNAREKAAELVPEKTAYQENPTSVSVKERVRLFQNQIDKNKTQSSLPTRKDVVLTAITEDRSSSVLTEELIEGQAKGSLKLTQLPIQETASLDSGVYDSSNLYEELIF